MATKRAVKVNGAVERLHAAFREHEAAAIEALELATVFINDGAYLSGARHLRDAAYKFENAQRARNDALAIMAGKQ